VVGIAAGPDTGNPVNGGVGAQIQGAHGTLTIDAQGHYSYTRTSSGTDIFTYTIQDGDGAQATAELTITVDDATPGNISIPQPGVAGAGTLADEAGLANGSNAPANSETTTGTITFTSPEDDCRDPNKESHLEPRTDAPTYAFGNKGKNAERGQGTVRKIIKYNL
jgi:large repetitive protein